MNKDKCKNCGGTGKLAERLIVPEAIGGPKTNDNTIVLCRACEMAIDATIYSASDDQRRAINFWVDTALYDHLNTQLKTHHGFPSMGSLVRYLMDKYVEQPDRFDDLDQYQPASADVKINVWVDKNKYTEFKRMVDAAGTTVTDAIKSLITMYASEAEILLKTRT